MGLHWIKIGGPKSWCRCGHAGDGRHSDHADTVQPGHGACHIRTCECEKFTFTRHMTGEEIQQWITNDIAAQNRRKGWQT